MKAKFLGAAHEVTGSCTFLEVNGHYGLVDCGMEQGADIFVNQKIPVNPSSLEFVLLTHAHIDHSGKIPLLFKNGYNGPVYATESTCALCDIMFRDSAHIQMSDAEWKNRKAERSGREKVEPLYDLDDVEATLKNLRPCAYGEMITVADGLEVRFNDIGHLLGSSAIEVFMHENGVSRKIVFSGDVGNKNQPIINDPKTIDEADFVVLESTYGDRLHDTEREYIDTLASAIKRTLGRGGNLVIPAFAVGRTQEILYFIREIKEKGIIDELGDFPVYVDSPLAIEATDIFLQCDTSNFDEAVLDVMNRGINPLVFPGLRLSVTSEESKLINENSTPKVIISASGMCEAGRIRHHLKHNLWRPESMVLFVGYQAAGTLGRIIYDGAEKVKLFGEEVAVNAEIGLMPGISGHADKNGLISWLQGFRTRPEAVIINHGEAAVSESFAECLRSEYGYEAYVPYSGAEFDLAQKIFTSFPTGVPVPTAGAQKKKNATYEKLLSAVDRLVKLVKNSEGRANKDLGKLTNKINEICDKWE